MTLIEQKNQVEAQLELEKGKGADKDIMLIAELETKQAQLLEQIMHEEQNQALQLRIQTLEVKREQWTLPTDLNTFFSSASHLDADGNPYVVTNGNRVVTQIVKDAIRANDEEWDMKFTEMETRLQNQVNSLTSHNNVLKTDSEDKDQIIADLSRKLSQAVIEKEEAENKRDAAIREREEIKIKESDDLQQILAEEEAEKARKAAEDRAKRTVYDVVGDSKIKGIESVNFTAKLAATGETITYNWMQKRYYIELTDENEILQFRQQHGESELDQSNNAEDPSPVQNSVEVPDIVFPSIPEATLHTTPATVESGDASEGRESGQAVTREEFEALKADVEQLKASASRWVA